MYLTKLEMPLDSRKSVGALTDCQKMHRLISELFGSRREEQNVLYRVRVLQGVIQVYLYSAIPPVQVPDGVCVIGQRDLTEWMYGLSEGDVLGFDLLTMPFKKVYRTERDKNSRRQILYQPEERMQWMNRKAEQNGFSIIQMQELEQGRAIGKHPEERGGRMYWDNIHYQGVLQIVDADQFRRALSTGIGPGKAYGLGMLLVKKYN